MQQKPNESQHKQNKMRLKKKFIACKWLSENNIWWWIKIIYIGHSNDAGTLWTRTTKMTAWSKQVNLLNHLWSGVSCHLKDQGETIIITPRINAHVHIEILDNFIIPSMENWIGNFQCNNAFCHRTKEFKGFLQAKHIKSMVNNLNLIENSWWKSMRFQSQNKKDLWKVGSILVKNITFKVRLP